MLPASGVKASFWLGLIAAASEVCPTAATAKPPLLAMPSGVASFQAVVPDGRTNSSQKLLCWAAGPPITTSAQVPPGYSAEPASARAPGRAGGAAWTAGAAPQPASSGGTAGGRERAPGAERHDVPRLCCAALASSPANDASELAVPGPGSKFSSVRVRPDPSMT